MGNWPDVAPGESIQHSARRENEINAILKAGDLFKDGRVPARSPQAVRVQAYNATNATIQPGQAAQIDVTGPMCNDAFPVVAFSDPDAPFGVFSEAVAPDGCAPFTLTGPAAVQITGSTGSYAMPTEEGVFERGDEGVRILHLSGGTAGIVLLGHYHGGTIYDEGIGIVIDGGTEGQNYTINTNITGDGENIVVTGGSAGNPLVITYTGSGGGGGGVGFPDYVALAGGTFSNALGEITDEDYDGTLPPPATIPDDPVLGITYVMPVPAGEPIKYYASADCLVRFAPFYEAGGEHYYYDLSESMEWTPNTGGHLRISILDDGSHSGDCIRIYVAGVDWSDALPIYKCAKFGPRGATGINSSVSGGTAFITLSGATGSVRFVGDGTVEIEGNTNNEIVLSSTGGGIGYPDYVALAGGTFSNALGEITDDDYDGYTPPGPTMPQDPILGITHILPVPANAPIKYYSSFSCLVRFAPEAGGTGHYYYDLSNEMEWTPNCKGWLRVSILDDGTHSSECIRLYVGGEDWSDAVAMHKCAKLTTTGVTGITSSVSGGTAFINPVNGTGSVRLRGENITISGTTNGEIVLTGSTSGGGGGGDDAVIIYQEEHTELGQITAQTNKKYYIALFGALYYDSESYNYVCQYYITYDHSTTPYTIVRHKTDYSDLESYWQGDGYSFELILPSPNEDCFIDICLFAFSTICISSAKPIYNYQGAPCVQPYLISNRNVKLVYIANDNGGRWYIYGN